MARTTKIVNFSLPPEIYKEVEELARQRETSRSQVLREALKQYVASERRWQQIRHAMNCKVTTRSFYFVKTSQKTYIA